MKKLFSLAAAAALVVGAAELPDYEISPKVGGIWHEGDTQLEQSLYYGVGVGMKVRDDIMMTLSYLHSNADYEDDQGDTDIGALFLNPEYYFNWDEKIKPYLTTGIGYQWVDENLYDNDDRLFFNYGAGLKYMAGNFDIGIEAKHLTSFSDGTNALWYGAMLSFPFHTTKEQPKPEPVKEEVQTPPERPAVSPTPPAVPKLPADSDKDGVIDAKDQCPKTPEGFQVNDKGCEVKFKFIVFFDTNKYDLKHESWESITKFTSYLRANPTAKAEIQGHTDSRASDAYNQTLSQNRAKAVYNALKAQGIEASRLSYKGYGETMPEVPNDSDENMALNRRVEAKIIKE